jgi:hypothetical protein
VRKMEYIEMVFNLWSWNERMQGRVIFHDACELNAADPKSIDYACHIYFSMLLQLLMIYSSAVVK